jgi:hypothetical protein
LCATALGQISDMKRPLTLTIRDKKDLIKVPTKFWGLVGHQQIGQTLILLDGDIEDVLTSKEVEKLLNKIKIKDDLKHTLLISNVTIEAERTILSRGLNLLRLNNFYWTDETYSQRQERMHHFIVERKKELFDERQNSEE